MYDEYKRACQEGREADSQKIWNAHEQAYKNAVMMAANRTTGIK